MNALYNIYVYVLLLDPIWAHGAVETWGASWAAPPKCATKGAQSAQQSGYPPTCTRGVGQLFKSRVPSKVFNLLRNQPLYYNF